ncbi:cyclic nucleotide-binding domain-containing protein [Sneathiella chinensis]|uniref:cyclic nucleotide-binding domain-containing protein n=1 Tax=Sneathiella chinensis TaxID=349750 RepID=UPI0019CF8205
MALISHLPNFADFSRVELEDFIRQASARRVEKNTHFFSEGETASSFYLLLDGYIRVVRISPSGEQIIVRYIASHELFGIAAAIGRDTYPANAVAAVDCVALAWPMSLWPDTVKRFPSFANSASATLGNRLMDVQDRVIELATEQVEHRVAAALLKLLEQAGKETEEGILIDIPLTRQDVSDMSGTTLHTVSRLLSSWEQSGLVKSSRKKVIITDKVKLTNLYNR